MNLIEEDVAVKLRQDTHDRFFDWKESNPGVYIGLSPEGSRLLEELIIGYMFCSEILGDFDQNHLILLENFFNDFPPKTPEDLPVSSKAAPSESLYIFGKLF